MKRLCTVMALVALMGMVACPTWAAEKEWTFLVFLNADNNLDQFGVDDEIEMSKVGSNAQMNIVTLIDRENGPAAIHYIEKNNVKTVKDLGEVDMGDYTFMVQFVKDMAAAYPAKHYALVIWNHGSGWDKKKNQAAKGISYDDSTGNHITTEQLGLAMADIKKVLGKNLDLFCMDACLMQMVEVAWAVKNSCDFIVASEETEPGEGYPYDGMLSGLTAGMSPAAFATHLVKAYAASYNDGSQGSKSSTQSAIACAFLNDLRVALDEMAALAIKGKYGKEFTTALNSVQEFYYSTNKDLGDLVQLLQAGIKDAAFQKAAAKVQDVLKKVIIANGHNGSDMAKAQGLAVYFPNSSYSFSSEYANLAWAKESKWDEMVADFYKKTNTSIVAEVANGDVSALADFVSTANADNRDVAADLIAKLNFRLHAEGGASASMIETVSNLIKDLKTR